MSDNLELATLDEAAKIVDKTPHNIRDYLQRQRISKYNNKGEIIERAKNGELRVSLKELRVFLALVNQGDEKHHHAGLHPELGFHGLPEYDKLRSDKSVTIIQGDSRKINFRTELSKTAIANRLIDGIFSSPPYVGQIDYHDQHVYAYEPFGFPRHDQSEIGPKKRGKSKQAQKDYVNGISAVLSNARPMLKDDGKVFIVANDRFQLYPEIVKLSGFKIVEQFQRAVTKRTEQGDDPYQETIFLMMKDL
ncbi:MAG: hypothetical protein V1899_00655 [Planctomycetota bacterium]